MNFMFEEINRFLAHEAQPDNFDALFGAPGWREFRERNGAPRKNGIREYYGSQLRSVGGARLIRSFEMRNKRDQTDYFLFFATNSRKGLSAMKRSMWKVDEMGTFQFSDATESRPVGVARKRSRPSRDRARYRPKFSRQNRSRDRSRPVHNRRYRLSKLAFQKNS